MKSLHDYRSEWKAARRRFLRIQARGCATKGKHGPCCDAFFAARRERELKLLSWDEAARAKG